MDPMKILVVDDEAQIREMLKRGLTQMAGHSVERGPQRGGGHQEDGIGYFRPGLDRRQDA